MEYLKEQQAGNKKPKNLGKIKQVSNDAAKRGVRLGFAKDEIDQEREPWCEECEIPEFDHSHLIPKAFNGYAYMSVKDNIRRNCRHHHTAWECGKLWEFPKMGVKYLQIIQSLDEQYYRQKVEQFRKRLTEYRNKNWLALSNKQLVLPDWVEQFDFENY